MDKKTEIINETDTTMDDFNVDQALKRLEAINQQLARQDISLKESIDLYKEGVLLADQCRKKLEGIEKELEIISFLDKDIG